MTDENETNIFTIEGEDFHPTIFSHGGTHTVTDTQETTGTNERNRPMMAKLKDCTCLDGVYDDPDHATFWRRLGWILFLWITRISLFAVFVASIVIGIIHLHDCPRESYIPIFLIVSGGFGLLRGVLSSIIYLVIRRHCNTFKAEARSKLFKGITACIMFAWNIVGAVWVYSIYKDVQSDDPAGEDYCNGTCYWYAFGSLIYMLIIQHIFFQCVVSLTCCREVIRVDVAKVITHTVKEYIAV